MWIIRRLIQKMLFKVSNCEGIDQTAHLGAIWSESALFIRSFLSSKQFEILEHLLYLNNNCVFKHTEYGSRSEKTCFWCFRLRKTYTNPLSYRDKLEYWNYARSKFSYTFSNKQLTKALIRLRGFQVVSQSAESNGGYYPPTKSEGYSFGVVRSSVRPFRPSALFVCLEPYLSTYWSDLIHSWYKW